MSSGNEVPARRAPSKLERTGGSGSDRVAPATSQGLEGRDPAGAYACTQGVRGNGWMETCGLSDARAPDSVWPLQGAERQRRGQPAAVWVGEWQAALGVWVQNSVVVVHAPIHGRRKELLRPPHH